MLFNRENLVVGREEGDSERNETIKGSVLGHNINLSDIANPAEPSNILCYAGDIIAQQDLYAFGKSGNHKL